MFNSTFPLIEAYLHVLVHPFRTHDYWRHNIPLWSDDFKLPKLTMPEALSISWIFWIIGAIAQIILINISLKLLLAHQNENDILYFLIHEADALFPYYLIVFSLLLDLVFFPILVLVQTEVMSWLIKFYAKLLKYQGSVDDVADQITTAALSSHFFSFIPMLGKPLVSIANFFLLYAGLRRNLGVSAPMSFVILMTPWAVLLALFTLFAFTIFCLVTL
jgi:hypothetical protein